MSEIEPIVRKRMVKHLRGFDASLRGATLSITAATAAVMGFSLTFGRAWASASNTARAQRRAAKRRRVRIERRRVLRAARS